MPRVISTSTSKPLRKAYLPTNATLTPKKPSICKDSCGFIGIQSTPLERSVVCRWAAGEVGLFCRANHSFKMIPNFSSVCIHRVFRGNHLCSLHSIDGAILAGVIWQAFAMVQMLLWCH